MAKQLEFLKGVTVPDGFRRKWTPRMSGWVNLHKHISQTDMNAIGYARLLIMELERETPRIDILLRLKGAFDIRRKQAERTALINAIR